MGRVDSIAGLAMAFAIVGSGSSFLIAALAFPFAPILGVLAAFIFGAVLGAWLNEYRDFRCP